MRGVAATVAPLYFLESLDFLEPLECLETQEKVRRDLFGLFGVGG